MTLQKISNPLGLDFSPQQRKGHFNHVLVCVPTWHRGSITRADVRNPWTLAAGHVAFAEIFQLGGADLWVGRLLLTGEQTSAFDSRDKALRAIKRMIVEEQHGAGHRLLALDPWHKDLIAALGSGDVEAVTAWMKDSTTMQRQVFASTLYDPASFI